MVPVLLATGRDAQSLPAKAELWTPIACRTAPTLASGEGSALPEEASWQLTALINLCKAEAYFSFEK